MAVIRTSLWRFPAWSYFLIAVLSVAATLAVRFALSPQLGSRSPLLLFVIPVALSAVLGGFWPGLVATVLSLLGALVFFIEPVHTFAIPDPADQISFYSNGLTYLLISWVAHFARRTAMRLDDAYQVQAGERETLENLLGSINDGFYAVDRNWNIVRTNAAMERILGKPSTDIVGQYLWDVFVEPDNHRTRVKMHEAMRTGGPVSDDVREPNSNRWLHLRAFPNAQGMFVYVHDITARKLVERSRERQLADERRARSDAEHANKMKDEFLATLSHELRTPLTTIVGWTELLKRQAPKGSAQNEGLEVIDRSARHQAKLIDELLDMSRIVTGKLKVDFTVVDLAELAEQAADLVLPTAQSKNIQLDTELEYESCWVRGDPERLMQVLNNLLTNALKFTSKNGRVLLSVQSDDGSVYCSIKDTGQGIEPEFVPHLFDRFRQADGSITRRSGGLGLGLSIAKNLVEIHGGTIMAFSEGRDRGSTFTFMLPRVGVPGGGGRSSPDYRSTDLTGLQVLVVEDDESTREFLQRVLTDAGAQVDAAPHAPAALHLVERCPYDVLLSDIGMPDLDGYEFMRKVRAMPNPINTIPAIALTAFASTEDAERSSASGYQRHIPKPVDIDRLLRTIRELADNARTSPPPKNLPNV